MAKDTKCWKIREGGWYELHEEPVRVCGVRSGTVRYQWGGSGEVEALPEADFCRLLGSTERGVRMLSTGELGALVSDLVAGMFALLTEQESGHLLRGRLQELRATLRALLDAVDRIESEATDEG